MSGGEGSIAEGSSSDRGRDRGGVSRAPLRDPVPRQAQGGRAARAGSEDPSQRRGDRPRLHHLRNTGNVSSLEGGPLSGAEEWVTPWARPPAWLYLPHQAATAGHETVDLALRRGASDVGETVTAEFASAGAEDQLESVQERDGRDLAMGRQVAGGAVREPRHQRVHAIRGHDAVPGPRTGASASASSSHERRIGDEGSVAAGEPRAPGGRSAGIRGQAPLPGPSGGSSARRMREQSVIDARLSTMAQSMRDHADRVEAKRARTGERPGGPTAAARIKAIRQRIADKERRAVEERVRRGGASSSDGAVGGGGSAVGSSAVDAAAVGEDGNRRRTPASGRHEEDDAAAHAATRSAQHDLQHADADASRRLRGS